MIKMVDLHKQDGCIRNDIDKAIADAVDECAFIKGAEVGTFEAELAHYVNAKYCISCGNGTDAITLALMAVGLRPGDEAIVPAFSFVAAAGKPMALLGGKLSVFAEYRSAYFQH
ncbi:MAG: DegT/DnrJ/EryC1/StrS family aminotransferase [Alistipes indistinctus]